MLKIRCNGVQALYYLHCFRRRLLPLSTSSSSTPTTTDSFANYLVESLGFSKQQSLSTSAKLSHYRRIQGAKNEVSSNDFNFVAKSDSVITFLTQIGLNQSNIRCIVNSDPRILLSDVPKTLEPKFNTLLDLGIPISDLATLIVANPFVLRSRLDPAIDDLKQVLGSNENVVLVLKRLTRNAFSLAAKYLALNAESLESYGISSDVFLKHFLYHPTTFAIRPELFRGVLIEVEQKLGIPRDSGMFCYGIEALISVSEKTIDSKFGVFKSFGWTDSDVQQLIRCNPYCLMISETKIKLSLDFLVNELHYEPAFLVTRPAFFSYSLEKRILPRYRVLEVLKEKGLIPKDYALYNAVALTEPKFLKKFVTPFQDVVPNLHEIYVTRVVAANTTG